MQQHILHTYTTVNLKLCYINSCKNESLLNLKFVDLYGLTFQTELHVDIHY